MEQVQEIVSRAASMHVLGSRHSFNDIADSSELLSLENVPADVVVDHEARTVSFGGGVTYGQLVKTLHDEGVALHTLASLPHISVAGAVATATHGSGVTCGNLATAVAGLELVRSGGEILKASRGDPNFDGLVVGLGALGAVTRITLDVQSAHEVKQRVFEGLSWKALSDHFDEITSCGYSVSIFTGCGQTHDQVWVKSRTDAPDRLPHFRMGHTPSSGAEIQSEYLVPRRHALGAIEAVHALSSRIRPLLQVSEIRRVAADRLWMSMNYEQDSVGIHFTGSASQTRSTRWSPRSRMPSSHSRRARTGARSSTRRLRQSLHFISAIPTSSAW
jgi:xylitol oxidase